MVQAIPEDAFGTLKREGYVIVGISEREKCLVDRVFEIGRSFFSAPLDVKRSASTPMEYGYRPFGIEYSQTPERPDRMETFSVASGSSHSISRGNGVARELHSAMTEVFRVFEELAEALTMGVAATLAGREIGYLRGAFHAWSKLQLNFSRPRLETGSLINDSHEDGGVFTLACSTGPGLEIQIAGNRFLPITAQPPEILIMPGEIAWLLSGGKIPPLYHRVRTVPELSERMALLLFADIDPRLCQPWIANAVNDGIDIGARSLTNVQRFGLKPFQPSPES